jgi:hypothetical protein
VLSLMKVSTIALVDTLTLYRNALKCVRIGRLPISCIRVYSGTGYHLIS